MNHMDYSHDTCLQMFTNDQKARMVAILNGSTMRINLAASTKCSIAAGLQHYVNTVSANVFPNPNAGVFTLNITSNFNNGEVQIVNLIGQIVYKQTVIQGYNTINTPALAKGLYYYMLLQNNQLVNKGKLVIE